MRATLTQRRIAVAPAPAEALAAMVARRETPVGLIVSPDAADARFVAARVLYDPSHVRQAAAAARVLTALQQYARARGRTLLVDAGIDPRLAQPVAIDAEIVGRPREIATTLYALLPPLIIFMIFLGGVYLAIDTTAGERERGSLEPLLSAPVRRWELLFGKALAAFAFTTATVLINLISFRIILGWVARSGSGFPEPPGWDVFGEMFAIALPLMVLAVALQFTIAAATRSMKEAQIYLGLLPVVPALPGMVMSLAPLPLTATVAAVPVLGQLVALIEIASGRPAALGHLVLSAAVAILVAAVFFRWAVRLFEKERQLHVG